MKFNKEYLGKTIIAVSKRDPKGVINVEGKKVRVPKQLVDPDKLYQFIDTLATKGNVTLRKR